MQIVYLARLLGGPKGHTQVKGPAQSWDERSIQEVVILDGIGNRGPDKNCSPEIRQNTDEPRT